MNSSKRPGRLRDRGVRSVPEVVVHSAQERGKVGIRDDSSLTVDVLCMRSSGLGLDEGASVCSPYWRSLKSDILRGGTVTTHQSIFSMVVMISPSTASTPGNRMSIMIW